MKLFPRKAEIKFWSTYSVHSSRFIFDNLYIFSLHRSQAWRELPAPRLKERLSQQVVQTSKTRPHIVFPHCNNRFLESNCNSLRMMYVSLFYYFFIFWYILYFHFQFCPSKNFAAGLSSLAFPRYVTAPVTSWKCFSSAHRDIPDQFSPPLHNRSLQLGLLATACSLGPESLISLFLIL